MVRKLTRAATPEEQLAQLKACYPKAFRTPPKPLALKTHQDLCIDMRPRCWEMVLPTNMYLAMARWTGSADYLAACTLGAIRYRLNGQPAGIVTDREAAWAREQLNLAQSASVD